MGRVFAQNEERRRDIVATAESLEMLLLHRQQHETATRSTVAAPIGARAQVSRFAGGLLKGGRPQGRALIRLSFTRVSARFALSVRQPSSRGRHGL